MSFYTCDGCDKPTDYNGESEAEYEIEKLDLRFCSYNCLVNYFKKINR